MQSFALYGEDAIFEGVLKRLEWVLGDSIGPQSYLEIGGFHPIIDSNTWHLYTERGWSGSVFEPNTSANGVFLTNRMSDTLYNYAVSNYSGEADFQIFSSGDSSNTINADFAKRKISAQHSTVTEVKKVKVITLEEAFAIHAEQYGQLFLLSIDAEGEDLNIISGYNFERYRPTFILIEDQPTVSFMPHLSSIRSVLRGVGYDPIASTILTTLYVDRLSRFFAPLTKMGRFE